MAIGLFSFVTSGTRSGESKGRRRRKGKSATRRKSLFKKADNAGVAATRATIKAGKAAKKTASKVKADIKERYRIAKNNAEDRRQARERRFINRRDFFE